MVETPADISLLTVLVLSTDIIFHHVLTESTSLTTQAFVSLRMIPPILPSPHSLSHLQNSNVELIFQ